MVDALRYYLTTITPETKDSGYLERFQDAVNGELVAVWKFCKPCFRCSCLGELCNQ
jgi:methionyl-tRNA synthetase